MVDKRPISTDQLETLIVLGSPNMMLLTTSRPTQRLLRRGFLLERDTGAITISPSGLRRLADEMETGRVAVTLDGMRARQRKGKADG